MSIYLDHASGWPLSAGVREAMARWIDEPGSPMALHDHARGPAQVVDDAHAAVAALVGWPPESVILTSGATEARNLAIKGTLSARGTAAPVIAADHLAHASTIATARSLTRHAGALRLADVDAVGDVLPRAIADAAGGADLVVVTHGQAEVGCVRNATALVAAARVAAPGAVIVLDAEETAGLLPVTDGHGADVVVIGGRSLGGPAWVGALLVRPGIVLHPLLEGGLEEHGKRGGAHDVPAIAALLQAVSEAMAAMPARAEMMRTCATDLTDGLLAVPRVVLNGPAPGIRLPGHVQVSARGVEGEALALAMAARGVAVAPGSACTFGAGKSSPVLEAMGADDDVARGAVLLTAGPGTTADDLGAAIVAFTESVTVLRAMAPEGQ